MDEIIFDSKTGRVVFKSDYLASQVANEPVSAQISKLHQNGHYLHCRDMITKSLHKTIAAGKAKYIYKKVSAQYKNTNIVMKFKSMKECAAYFNLSKNTIKYHIINCTPTKDGWLVKFDELNIKSIQHDKGQTEGNNLGDSN